MENINPGIIKSQHHSPPNPHITEFELAHVDPSLSNVVNSIYLDEIVQQDNKYDQVHYYEGICLKATDLIKSIPKEELQMIHKGFDGKLQSWLHENKLSSLMLSYDFLPDFSDYSRIDNLVEVEEIDSGSTEKLGKRPHEEAVMQSSQLNTQNISLNAHMMGKPILNIRDKHPGIISWIPEDDDATNNIHHQDFEDLHQTLGAMPFNIHNNNNNIPKTPRRKQKKARQAPRNIGITATGQRKRRRWSDEEVEYLVEGIRLFGVGSWKDILSSFPFGDRTYVDLKDKFRNLRKKYSLEELLGSAVVDPTMVNEENKCSS